MSAARRRTTRRRLVAGALFAGASATVAAFSAWPIYRSGSFVMLVLVAVGIAGGISVVAQHRGWRGRTVALAVAAAFLVLGVPLAVPSRLGSPWDALRGMGELGAGILFGWKDLVTVDLPVGDYRNLLVPALVVFLAGTCALLRLSWRSDGFAYAAGPVALAMTVFGLFFGRTVTSAPREMGPLVLHAPLETAVGVAGLVTTLLWLAWRSHDERIRALRRAASSSGVRVSRRTSRVDRRRHALGAGMVAVAVVAAVAVVPWAARGADREVLRSAVGPEIDLARAVSPLSAYRSAFADPGAGDVLFRVSADGTPPQRMRIATLDRYDGEVFRAGGAEQVAAARFVRVPSVLDAGPGDAVAMSVSIDALRGIWVPTAGRLSSVVFGGERSSALADRFYYSAAASGGVQTAGGGLTSGDSYRLSAVEPRTPALDAVEAPGGVPEDAPISESLREWVQDHRTGSDGTALAGLVALLRERGYLSHALEVDPASPPAWMTDLPGYSFQPSASGHSLARIDAMFQRLLERERDPRAESSGNYVAAIGDDEQFAVAAALVARELGFPSRVVLGMRLSSVEPGLAVCDAAACREGDLSAWIEVQSRAGDWIPVDVTPQAVQSPSLDVSFQRDPRNVTEVRPDAVEEVVPPDPFQEDSTLDDDAAAATGLNLAWLWPALRVAGVVLLVALVLFGPFIAVVAAKALRRRSRRATGSASARIASGWDEYADAAVDAGRQVPRDRTRLEVAAELGGASERLAVVADRAVFSGLAVHDVDAEEYWRLVDDERAALIRADGLWRALVSSVSLRSFYRHLAPVVGVGTRIAERGRRRIARSARTAS